MKLAVRPYELEGNIEGEEFDFDFDRDSLVHLMNQFIDLYDDKEMAVLREYACNALDSHRAAGNRAPIEITLPTHENPTLLIQDYGIGLSRVEVLEIYSKYGASTKRDSDAYTGALGVGCKAGLTYTPQFTMVVIKDGLRNTVLVSRHEGGVKGIIVERDAETNDHDGVTIQIPCAHHNRFAYKAKILFQYWDRGTVLVDGEEPERFQGQHIIDNLYLRRRANQYDPKHVVVMGGVPYPFNASDLGWDIGHDHDVVAFVPIGTLEFPPDREGLRDTKGNKAALFRIGQTLINEMQRKAQTEIDECANPVEAIRKAYHWNQHLPEKARPKEGWTYKGEVMPLHFEAPLLGVGVDGEVTRTRWTVVPQKGNKKSEHTKTAKTPFVTAINAIWFYGYDVQFSANHRTRLAMWHHAGNTGAGVPLPPHYILCLDKPDMTYLKEDQVFDWQTVRSIKLPHHNTGGGGGRLAGSYDVVLPGDMWPQEILAASIDQDESIYYFEANQPSGRGRNVAKREDKAKPWITALRHFDPRATVVLLPPIRLRKFREQFPAAENLTFAVKAKFNRWAGQLSYDSRRALAIHQAEVVPLFKGLKADQIIDPDIREALTLIDRPDFKTLEVKYASFARIGHNLELPKWNNPLTHYPLMTEDTYGVRRFRERNPGQVTAYLNGAYPLRLHPEGL